MNADNIYYVYNLAYITAILFSLFFAGRILIKNLSLFSIEPLSKRLVQIIIWFSLAGFLILPLIDILRIITVLNGGDQFVSLWGVFSWSSYSILFSITTIAIYSITMVIGIRTVYELNKHIHVFILLTNFENKYIILSFGGLVNYLIRLLLTSIFFPQFPTSATPLPLTGLRGLLFGWLLGILILAIAILAFNEFMSKREEETR